MPSDKAEIVSQLLFGETFRVIDTEPGWLHIRSHHDDYEGWIDPKQAHPYQASTTGTNTVRLLETVSAILNESGTKRIHLTKGAVLPGFENGQFTLETDRYMVTGKTNANRSFHPDHIVSDAMDYLGSPYLWGGRSPFGIDCSGFTQMVFALNGIALPRDSSAQVSVGEKIGDLQKGRVGDLAFFAKEPAGKVMHVGIILPHQRIIHASGEVRLDAMDDKGIIRKETGEYSHFLTGIQRYF